MHINTQHDKYVYIYINDQLGGGKFHDRSSSCSRGICCRKVFKLLEFVWVVSERLLVLVVAKICISLNISRSIGNNSVCCEDIRWPLFKHTNHTKPFYHSAELLVNCSSCFFSVISIKGSNIFIVYILICNCPRINIFTISVWPYDIPIVNIIMWYSE